MIQNGRLKNNTKVVKDNWIIKNSKIVNINNIIRYIYIYFFKSIISQFKISFNYLLNKKVIYKSIKYIIYSKF